MLLNRYAELGVVLKECVCSNVRESMPPERALSSFQFLLHQVKKVGGIVYVVGNGGSAGISSHFCTDLLRTLEIPSSVISDSSVTTCFANDFGYENVYSMPLFQNMRSHDLLVTISSSGKSANIINAAKMARSKGSSLVTLSGFSEDNPLRQLGDLNFWIPSFDYGLVETGHFFILHTVIDTCKTKSSPLTKLAP